MMAMRTCWSLGIALLALAPGVALADETPWPTMRAAELVEDGRAHEKAGLVDSAIDRYREAIQIDPTFADAYLALAALRTATGDVEEAETTYAAGIDHVLGFTEAYVARAELLRGEGKARAALGDLLAAASLAPMDPVVGKKLLEAAIGAGQLPLALATARRLVVLAHTAGDATAEKSGRVTAIAIARLIGGVDPVFAGASEEGAPRRAIAISAGARPERK
jgi:tetratricopeptide (TPR) repeat protein